MAAARAAGQWQAAAVLKVVLPDVSHPIAPACRLATDKATNSSMKLIERMAQFDSELMDHIAMCRDAIGHSRDLLAQLDRGALLANQKRAFVTQPAAVLKGTAPGRSS